MSLFNRAAPEVRLTRVQRECAQREAAQVSQDVPLRPTAEMNPLPILPEEAGDGLSPEQRLAVAAMVAGQTFTMAARAAGVDRRTLYRWRREPALMRVIDALTRDALETSATRVRNLMLRATRVLAELMNGPEGAKVAIRVVNSARLWAAMNLAETRLDERGADFDEPIAPPAVGEGQSHSNETTAIRSAEVSSLQLSTSSQASSPQ